MSAFVIAKRDDEFLDTPVFHAGQGFDEEAVAVFTNRSLAEKYMDAAGWTDDHRVEPLSAMNLLRWMVHAHEDNAHYLTVDPNRASHLDGQPQPVIVIEQELAGFAEQLTRDVIAKRLEVASRAS